MSVWKSEGYGIAPDPNLRSMIEAVQLCMVFGWTLEYALEMDADKVLQVQGVLDGLAKTKG